VIGSIAQSVRARQDIHIIAAATAVFAWGTGPIMNKVMTVDTPAIVLYRTLLGTPLMIAVAYATGGSLTKDLLKKTALPGVLFALSFITGFASIKMTSIANATLITTIQPVLVVFIAPRLFGERLSSRQLGYSFLSLAGVLLVVMAAASSSGAHISGDAMAVGNVVLWTGYFVLAKKNRLAGVHSWSFLAAIFVWLAVVVIPFGLVTSNDLGNMTTKDWLCALGMTIGPGLVGHGLMTWSQSHVDVTIASLLGLLSPVVSTVLALVFLSEGLTAGQLVGGCVVLVSLGLLVRHQRGIPEKPVIEVAA
jgi:drug/metabolite transporter (DMT)-like permease